MTCSREGLNLIGKSGRLERRLRALTARVHPFVLLPVDCVDGCLGLAEVGVFGRRSVERDGGRHALFANLEQVPGHATAEAETDHPNFRTRHSLLEFVDAGLEVRNQLLGWGVRKSCRGGRRILKRPCATL